MLQGQQHSPQRARAEERGLNRRSLSAIVFLTIFMTIATWDGLYHYVLFPLCSPRFDGVVVYVDNLGHDYLSGWILLVAEGEQRRRVDFSSAAHHRFTLIKPQGIERVNLVIAVNSLGSGVNVQVVDGLTGRLLKSENNKLVVQGESCFRELLVLSTSYARGE